jgi:hypothetical protein
LLAHEPEKDLLRQTKSFLKKHAAVNHGCKFNYRGKHMLLF